MILKQIVKKGELAKMLGVHPAYIDTYIKRGNIVADGKLVDTTHPANASFIQHIIRKNAEKERFNAVQEIVVEENKFVAPKSDVKPSKKGTKQTQNTKQTQQSNENQGDESIYNIKIQKEQADLEKKLLDAERVRLINAKMRGENVPTKMVKNLVSQFSNSIITTYKDAADRLIMEFSHRKKLTLEEKAEMKGELISIINRAHDEAIEKTKTELESIIATGPDVSQMDFEDE
jgi:hypothetical protein